MTFQTRDPQGQSLSSSLAAFRLHLLRPIRHIDRRLLGQESLPASLQIPIFFLVLLTIYLRLPGLFLHAQFYAEDGAVWYADAYNLGWLHSLTLPDGGYLNTLQRLGGGASLLVPLRWAPLLMAALGALVEALPVPILLSARLASWAALPTRILMAILYVALPNAREVHVVLTNSQWHLALVAAMLAFAAAPRSWVGRAVDSTVFLVMGFSGPYGLILLPLIAVFWYLRRQSWTRGVLALYSIGTAVQAFLLFHHHGDRIHQALGASPQLLIRLIGGNVIGCGLLGAHQALLRLPLPLLAFAILAALALCTVASWSAGPGFTLFVLFCGLLLIPELRSPLIAGPTTRWAALLQDQSGRYWFFPELAFLWSVAWCALEARARSLRLVCGLTLVLMTFGIASDWLYDPYPNENYPAAVQRFGAARPGDHVRIAVIPEPIQMELVKK